MTPTTNTKPRPFLSREEWLAKRQARRERQREQNIARAAQMHEARLAHVPPPANQEAAAKLSSYYVGCSGWFYWHWRDRFYPAGLKTSDWFPHYAKRFQDRRTQRTVLRLANRRDRQDLEKTKRAAAVCLHREGQRAHHACPTILAHV